MPGGSLGTKRITEAIERSDDAFGTRIADGRRNTFDVASQYNFSPERLRLFVNGSRAFVQYNGPSQFTDSVDTWDLQPSAGDEVHIETAESAVYIVNYVTLSSAAFGLNQSLQDGDVLRFGAFNGEEGWVMEQRGTDHDDHHVDIIQYRQGVRTTLEENAELSRPTTEWCRYEVAYNWYNAGQQTWKQTYTINGSQFNDTIAETSIDGERGPAVANLNIWQQIEAGADTTGLVLEAGSMGGIVKGAPRAITRSKPQYESVTVTGTADAWEPVYAIRLDPDNSNVNAQFTRLNILSYSSNATIELVAASFDETKTDITETDWDIPDYQHPTNSAAQYTEAVSQVADTTGTVKDLTSTDKFGGYTVATSVDVDGGNVAGSAATNNPTRIEKKNVLASDHIVLLARTGTTGGTLHFDWNVEQRW